MPDRRRTRRQALAAAAGVGCSAPLLAGASPAQPEEFPGDGEAAIGRLKAGNGRFA